MKSSLFYEISTQFFLCDHTGIWWKNWIAFEKLWSTLAQKAGSDPHIINADPTSTRTNNADQNHCWVPGTSFADPDPGSGAFLPPGSVIRIGIRDGAMVGSGSRIRDKQTKFDNSLYTKRGRIRDSVLFYPPDPGSGSGMEQGRIRIRDKTSRIRNTAAGTISNHQKSKPTPLSPFV
jgi:hypothetical protein